ncbi:interleukin-1 receptor-associated kinase 3 [Mixophyes fleayi]|uniref:interleukin-1 receptor-associated kinase 3 n=1 Tax=Mixophyes fleayi TaxID=3061075 RepID=UPI003F4E20AA
MANLSLSSGTSLFEVPPLVMENFCDLMDCSDGELGWRGLAERLTSDWMDFRKIEKYADQGKSRTKELLWSWAHKNKTVGDLLVVLQEMGLQRAITLFTEINVQPHVSFKEIKEETNGFHRDFLIGEGHFYEVFKAEIKKQSCVVKLLKQKNELSDQKQLNLFLTEWKSLPRFQHSNILELLGFITEEGKTCLLYPYMSNGSLFHRIHCTGNTPALSWQIRYNILLGVARAIQYLHSMDPYPVVCGNLTSKNILLDQHFQPKLSDFAMIHLRSYLINHSHTIRMDNATMWFLGYLPEEYIRKGELSPKTDVYSYGIVTMEVLSGCQAVLNESKCAYLRDIFWSQMENSGSESLQSLMDMKSNNWPFGVAQQLLGVAIESTTLRSKQRPTMEEVLEKIESCKKAAEKSSEDQPKSLMSVPPCLCPLPWSHSNVPVESDESLDYAFSLERKLETPCECSQSEVTFLGVTRKYRAEGKDTCPAIQSNTTSYNEHILHTNDLSYSSRPMECSCSPGPDADTTFCEECIANGFGQCNVSSKNVT